MLNVGPNGGRCPERRISLHDSPLSVDQEFGEIPFDGLAAKGSRDLRFQKRIERVSVLAIDVDFFEQRKANLISHFAKIGNFLAVARFLLAELVAREAQNCKALIFEFPIKLLQSAILRREAAAAGRVDDQQHLAFERLQRNRFAGEAIGAIGIDGFHKFHAACVCSDFARKKFLK